MQKEYATKNIIFKVDPKILQRIQDSRAEFDQQNKYVYPINVQAENIAYCMSNLEEGIYWMGINDALVDSNQVESTAYNLIHKLIRLIESLPK